MTPIAQIDKTGTTDNLSYLHTDHLMTPRFATNQNQQITWRWEGEAFGNTADQVITSEVNLRFPGQYLDRETNSHYNHFRYYNPNIGRYNTSDPIGLDGGSNTFLYSLGNAVRYYDDKGLHAIPPDYPRHSHGGDRSGGLASGMPTGPGIGHRGSFNNIQNIGLGSIIVGGGIIYPIQHVAGLNPIYSAVLISFGAGLLVGDALNSYINSLYPGGLGGYIYDLQNGRPNRGC